MGFSTDSMVEFGRDLGLASFFTCGTDAKYTPRFMSSRHDGVFIRTCIAMGWCARNHQEYPELGSEWVQALEEELLKEQAIFVLETAVLS